MIDLLNQHIVPDVKEAGIGPLAELETFAPKLKTALAEIAKEKDSYKKAQMARVLRLQTMIEIREVCDEAEEVVPAKIWSLATYKELLFLDSHTSQTAMDPMENDDYSI
jgi:glutamine synthetase|mmetsp:Transcript_8538/g.20375  ORF Transcript_8538/g.20375 Transcript_8538/m.20375 type:complete len:109 (+) Transcript_8538:1-327(+)